MSLLKAAMNNFCQGMSAHQEKKKIITTTLGGKCGHDLQNKTRCNYEGRYLKKRPKTRNTIANTKLMRTYAFRGEILPSDDSKYHITGDSIGNCGYKLQNTGNREDPT